MDPSSMSRVTGTMSGVNGGSMNNMNNMNNMNMNNSDTMFNTNGIRTIIPGANSTNPNRNTVLQSSSSIGMDQTTNGQAMNTSNPLMQTTRGFPMQTFTCMPMHSSYQTIPFMNNSGIPMTIPMNMYSGNVLPQMSDADMSNLPMLENYLSLQSIPTEQQQLFLPSLSNMGAFSNRSLGSQSPGASKQNNMKPAVGNLTTTNQNPVPVFNQLPNGSQYITPTKHLG